MAPGSFAPENRGDRKDWENWHPHVRDAAIRRRTFVTAGLGGARLGAHAIRHAAPRATRHSRRAPDDMA
jgi:hypothetical protein